MGSWNKISTHTPLAGRDKIRNIRISRITRFLLTRPSRGAILQVPVVQFAQIISTHTPLAGRDSIVSDVLVYLVNFYSHAPRGARFYGATWRCQCN